MLVIVLFLSWGLWATAELVGRRAQANETQPRSFAARVRANAEQIALRVDRELRREQRFTEGKRYGES